MNIGDQVALIACDRPIVHHLDFLAALLQSGASFGIVAIIRCHVDFSFLAEFFLMLNVTGKRLLQDNSFCLEEEPIPLGSSLLKEKRPSLPKSHRDGLTRQSLRLSDCPL
jgi:hypothetical protein